VPKETQHLHCIVSEKEICHCFWWDQNRKFFARIIQDKSIRQKINRNGYDEVTWDLVQTLLYYPESGVFTAAFGRELKFSTEMLSVRNNILYLRWKEYLYHMETDLNNIRCPVLKQYIEEHGYNPAVYLEFLKRQHHL
jgi:hypothetical protein